MDKVGLGNSSEPFPCVVPGAEPATSETTDWESIEIIKRENTISMKLPTPIRLLLVLAILFISAGLTGCSTLVKSIDHQSDRWENADLWRRVKDKPAVFVPRAFGTREPSRSNGDWVVDPQDQAAFFIPFSECGDLNTDHWRGEALKNVNRYTQSRQRAVNAATVLFGWPAYTALFTTAAVLQGVAQTRG